MSRSSQRLSDPAYYIEDCRISSQQLVIQAFKGIGKSPFIWDQLAIYASSVKANKLSPSSLLEINLNAMLLLSRAISFGLVGNSLPFGSVSKQNNRISNEDWKWNTLRFNAAPFQYYLLASYLFEQHELFNRFDHYSWYHLKPPSQLTLLWLLFFNRHMIKYELCMFYFDSKVAKL